MTMGEYQEIVRIINNSTYERLIYQEIEKQLQSRGYRIPDISLADYVQLRNWLDAMNRAPFVQAILTNEENSRQAPKRKSSKKLNRNEKDQILGTLVISGLFVLLTFILPACFLIPLLMTAFIALVIGLADFIPFPRDYNPDYVERYFKAQEDARINTEAYLHQAYLHKDEIRILNDMISK